MNVLVVDDDREIVESIAIFLSGENYKVFKAYNGIDALDVLTENDIHLMILDIMMPGSKVHYENLLNVLNNDTCSYPLTREQLEKCAARMVAFAWTYGRK